MRVQLPVRAVSRKREWSRESKKESLGSMFSVPHKPTVNPSQQDCADSQTAPTGDYVFKYLSA